MGNTNKTISTIMFTDIVGYSSMINNDESHALDLLSKHDEIIEPIIKKNQGKIIKKIGDAIFAEFNESLSCIKTAIETQDLLHTRNKTSENKDKIIIRIGLHIGEVIRKDDDLFGHDVNLCSRIESIAPRGGIAASINLIESLMDDYKFYKREIGYVKLKNISHPLQIFKIYFNQDDYNLETDSKLQQSLKDNGVKVVDIDTFSIDNISSIGVLYINNLGDKNDDSIAYNLTNDLITDIDNIPTLRSSSLNDIAEYKDSNLSTTDIARKLQVDNILKGSFLKKDNNLELSFELLDINKGSIIWSDKWTSQIIDNKKIRKHILTSLSTNLNFNFPKELNEYFSEEITLNPKALEVYYKGKYISDFIKSNDELVEGKALLEQSIELDSDFVEAYSEYGLICQRLGKFDLSESSLTKAKEIANKKNDNQGLASIYNVLHILYQSQGKYIKANEHIEKALEIQVKLNNSLKEANFRTNYSTVLNYLNKPDLALEQLTKSIKIKESLEENHILGPSYANMMNTYLKMGDFSNALEYATLALGVFRKNEMVNFEARVLVVIADIYMIIGNYDKMKKYLTDAKDILKQFNEPMLNGKLELNLSRSFLNEDDNDSAIDSIDNCIDNFEMAEQKIFVLNAYIEKLMILILYKKLDKAKKLISKIDMLLNKIDNPPKRKIIEVAKLYIDGKNIVDEFDFKTIEDSDNPLDTILSYYITSLFFIDNQKIDEAKDYQKKAISVSNDLANKISQETDKNHYIENEFFSKLIREDIKLSTDKPDTSKPEQEAKPNVFAFCPACGFKNENNFAFCPSCGNDLKQ